MLSVSSISRLVPLGDRRSCVSATSRPLTRDPAIAGLFGQHPILQGQFFPFRARHIIGWGAKRSGRRALALKHRADEHHLLEDGFLRSIGRRDVALGIAFDRDGIYYDAGSDSRLFRLAEAELTESEVLRARALQAAWQHCRLSKYNDAPPPAAELPERFVLVVDQVRGDLSISLGLAGEATFQTMLETALAENPGHVILVKVHPDSLSDPAKRHFDIARLSGLARVKVIAEPCHIADLIERADAVYTVTSQAGFEALLWGKPVRCFGMPFYGGRGLTRDDLPRPSDRRDISLEQLIHAALVEYPRYWHPVLRQECDPEAIVELVALNRKLRFEFPREIHAIGFSRWKKPFIRQFLTGCDVRFVKSVAQVPNGGTLLVWGNGTQGDARSDLNILRAEDGFLRSSGLGADLVRPLSLVIDDIGIYYDATRPSRLERILAEKTFSAIELPRAAALREQIVSAGINKYNLGGKDWERPEGSGQVILVVGQVETDASICFGSPEVKTNLELLQRVRRAHPDAYILYKPHPDVVAGLRRPGSEESKAADHCDEIVVDVDPNKLMTKVDAVHTMTSLMGFEALLRGVPVTCHGLPFYAGWGLTRDLVSCPRRGRRRSLDELVHAALIEYPRYFSVQGQVFTQPEHVLLELAQLAGKGPATRAPHRKLLRRVLGMWAKVRQRQ